VTDGSASLLLTDPHDDVVTTVTLPADQAVAATGISGWSSYDEYGNAATGSAAAPLGYGWLGGKQRSADAGSSELVLMGARVYNTRTGRFTSSDPVAGGNENSFNYPDDPVNKTDIDGLFGMPHFHIKLPKLHIPQLPYGAIIDHINTGLSVAAMFGCGPCGAISAGISVARGAYKVFVKHDRSGWMDIADGAMFGAAKGLEKLGELNRVRKMARFPKGVAGEARSYKRARGAIAAAHRAYERRYVARALRASTITSAANVTHFVVNHVRHKEW
jgi:RHS repeat-associated protein